MRPIGLIAAICFSIVGCQTPEPKFVGHVKKPLSIDGYQFERSVAGDANGSAWKVVEIKPSKLPYSGKIAKQSAEERWLKLFESALVAIKEDCKGPPKEMPEFRAAELDYSKLGHSPEHPAYIQARYRCQ